MTRAWMQTITGRTITIAQPAAKDVDPLTDLPEMLAGIPRFNAAVPGGSYSVAQHCAIMCDVVLEETGDAALARLALLHDAHEYIIGDFTTPTVASLVEIEIEFFKRTQIEIAIRTLKDRLDCAIFKACGVPWPASIEDHRKIKAFDLRMLATEARQLLADANRQWPVEIRNAKPVRMRGGLTIWPRHKAAEEYRKRLVALCPNVRRHSPRLED